MDKESELPSQSPPQLAPASPTPAQRLERLKVIVKHLSNTWPHVLQRQSCMQSLGRREDVHSALRETYAAHITNMLQDVLVLEDRAITDLHRKTLPQLRGRKSPFRVCYRAPVRAITPLPPF
jgi:hypothetical protein